MAATINQTDLPHSTGRTQLRRTISRVIECEFEVTDDAIREIRDTPTSTFRPTSAAVRINIDNGNYTVEVTGPHYSRTYGRSPGTVGHVTLMGEHYADIATDYRYDIATDAVTACLVAHDLVQQ